MLESLFGSAVIEKILFYLVINDECYPSQLKGIFHMSLFSFQRGLGRLEKGGIIINSIRGIHSSTN